MTTPRVTVPVEPEFTHYRRSQIAHLRPYVVGEALSDRVSISAADLEAGSPKPGDMIARNPANHDDQWLVAADYFAANFEPVSAAPAPEGGVVFVAARALLDACIADFGDPKDFPDDDGWVASGDKGDSAVTFKHMRDLQAALRAQPPAREDAQPVAGMRVHLVRDKNYGHLVVRHWCGIGDLTEGEHVFYTHPAPDAMRDDHDAVTRTLAALIDPAIDHKLAKQRLMTMRRRTALQAEQGAK